MEFFASIFTCGMLVLLIPTNICYLKKKYPDGSPRGPDFCEFTNCSMKEENNQHIFCKCHDYKVPVYEPMNNMSSYRAFAMHWHNHFRNRIALGEETMETKTKEKMPKASNMIALSWDYIMEDGARCNAKKGVVPLQHDRCHFHALRPKFNGGGQNLFWQKGKPNCETQRLGKLPDCEINKLSEYEVVAYMAMYLWYEELTFVDNMTLIDDFRGVHKVDENNNKIHVGHMFAMLWAMTTTLGCAASNGGADYFYTCNYYPDGNVRGKPVYIRGEPATQCDPQFPANKDPRYPGLCGLSELPSEPPKEFFFSLSEEPAPGSGSSLSFRPQAFSLSLILSVTILVSIFTK